MRDKAVDRHRVRVGRGLEIDPLLEIVEHEHETSAVGRTVQNARKPRLKLRRGLGQRLGQRRGRPGRFERLGKKRIQLEAADHHDAHRAVHPLEQFGREAALAQAAQAREHHAHLAALALIERAQATLQVTPAAHKDLVAGHLAALAGLVQKVGHAHDPAPRAAPTWLHKRAPAAIARAQGEERPVPHGLFRVAHGPPRARHRVEYGLPLGQGLVQKPRARSRLVIAHRPAPPEHVRAPRGHKPERQTFQRVKAVLGRMAGGKETEPRPRALQLVGQVGYGVLHLKAVIVFQAELLLARAVTRQVYGVAPLVAVRANAAGELPQVARVLHVEVNARVREIAHGSSDEQLLVLVVEQRAAVARRGGHEHERQFPLGRRLPGRVPDLETVRHADHVNARHAHREKVSLPREHLPGQAIESETVAGLNLEHDVLRLRALRRDQLPQAVADRASQRHAKGERAAFEFPLRRGQRLELREQFVQTAVRDHGGNASRRVVAPRERDSAAAAREPCTRGRHGEPLPLKMHDACFRDFTMRRAGQKHILGKCVRNSRVHSFDECPSAGGGAARESARLHAPRALGIVAAIPWLRATRAIPQIGSSGARTRRANSSRHAPR